MTRFFACMLRGCSVIRSQTNRRMDVKLSIYSVFLAAVLFGPGALQGDDPFYLGTWKIDSAQVAPWVEKGRTPDPTEMKSLVGKTITIAAKGITGPGFLSCKAPKYQVKDYPPDFLFQGSFGEMQMKDKSVDPAKVAAKLGFTGKTSKALETGCANEIDYHFPDMTTAEFGLNDYVYILKKQ